MLVYAVGQQNAASGPDVLARTDADHLAAGRASAAAAMVAPVATSGATIDPALLSDTVLRDALERITVNEVVVDDADETKVGESASARIAYTLRGQLNLVQLRVNRLPNTWGVLRHWQLAEDLAMPVIIETNVDTIASGRLGAATILVRGPGLQGFPQHRFMLYPGVYHVTGIDSPWIRAVRDVAVDDNRTRYLSETSPTAQVWYEPTAALWDRVRSDADRQARACAAAGADMVVKRCPMAMARRNDRGTLRVVTMPTITSLGAVQTEYRADGTTAPMWQFQSATNGEFTYTGGGKVEAGHESFDTNGSVRFTRTGSRSPSNWPRAEAPARPQARVGLFQPGRSVAAPGLPW
ncbi:MAG: hypothetical protein U0Q10_03510 [Dermatophilaceae bacterium]